MQFVSKSRFHIINVPLLKMSLNSHNRAETFASQNLKENVRKVVKLAERREVVVERASRVLLDNGVVALPTDTLYGLAGQAQSTVAVERIYGIKERHNEKPLAICVGDIADVYKWAHVHCDGSLLEKLLPGPVTLLFKRKPELNPDLNPGVGAIGIRIPDSDFIRDLCRACQAPLALTSANASAALSTLCVDEFEYLWPKIDLIVDGGAIGAQEGVEGESASSTPTSREGSTVVDLTRPRRFRIIRAGSALIGTRDVLRREYGMDEDE